MDYSGSLSDFNKSTVFINLLKTVLTLPEEHAGGSQHKFMCSVMTVSHKDGAVTEVALLLQGPQLLHQLAAVVGELHHFE